MFAKLGAKVVVIEFMENILQMLDVDLKVRKAKALGAREAMLPLLLATLLWAQKTRCKTMAGQSLLQFGLVETQQTKGDG